jgi:hypothetical protein
MNPQRFIRVKSRETAQLAGLHWTVFKVGVLLGFPRGNGSEIQAIKQNSITEIKLLIK